MPSLKFLIEEYARLYFPNFLSTLLANFHVINKKILPLFRSARLLIRDFRLTVSLQNTKAMMILDPYSMVFHAVVVFGLGFLHIIVYCE